MFADAFAAERLRFSKARGTLFWAFLFVPIVSLVIGVATHIFFNVMIRKSGGRAADLATAPMDLARQAGEAMTGSNFFLIQLFFMIGASAIMASDYRWETWRQLTPRNTRTNLLLAKLATFGVGAAAGVLLLALAGVLTGIAGALINGHPIVLSGSPAGLALKQLAGGFIISWLELMVLGAFAAVVTVLTRSGLGAMLSAVGLSIVQAFVISQLRMPDPGNPPLQYIAGLPAFAAEVLRATLLSGPMDPKPAGAAFALVFLLAWIAGLSAIAVVLFRRQDLTRE
jgi:ABC-2 type transport system permease protein